MNVFVCCVAATLLLISTPEGAGEASAPSAGAQTAGPAPALGDFPDTLAERNRLVAELYDRLRQSPDVETSTKITGAIERLWVYSGSDTADLLLARAAAAIEAKQVPVARQVLDALIGIEPGYAEAWNRRAYLSYSEQNYAAAIADLGQVLAIDPQHFKALEGLGTILKEIGHKRLALRAFRRVLEINPRAAEARQAEEALSREVEGQKI